MEPVACMKQLYGEVSNQLVACENSEN